jgi:hypothetical protein
MNTNFILLCFDPLVPFGLPHMKIVKHFPLSLQRWSQWSWKVMILTSSSFNVTNALPISMVFFLIGRDCGVHELFSWCCQYIFCVNHPLPSQLWSQCLSSLGATNAFLISIVFFLFNGSCDVYEFFSQCY